MDDWLQSVLPTVLSAVVAGAIALAGLFASTRRLRSALAADGALIEYLPEDAKAEMREEIRRRGFRLIALTRWPSLSRYEVLCILGLVLTAPIAYWFMWDVNRSIKNDLVDWPSAIISGLGMFVAPYLIWASFYGSWSQRTFDRLMFLRQHLLDSEHDEMVGLVRLANRFAVAAYLPCFIYPVAYLMWISKTADWPVGIPAGGGTAMGVVSLLVFQFTTRENPLLRLLLGGSRARMGSKNETGGK